MATSWVSQISGPIPNHQIYEQDDNIYYDKKQQNNLKVEKNNLNLCGKGYIGMCSNRNVSPKDHMMENVKRMREIHRASRQRQENNKLNRGPIKSTGRPDSCIGTSVVNLDFQVPNSSKVCNNKSTETHCKNNNNIHERAQSATPNVVTKLQIGHFNDNSSTNIVPNNNKNYLRAHSKTGPPLNISSYSLAPIRKEISEIKISVPRASTAREVQLIRRDIDFVRANAYSVKSARLRRSQSVDFVTMSSNTDKEKKKQRKPGELPAYLIKRRNQWKEDEQFYISNQPDPDQPPGHRKMSDKERLATLELLKSNEKDMLTELGRLPIRTDTLKLRTKKQEIEQKLNELEEAIKIFSKPKVFVQCDN